MNNGYSICFNEWALNENIKNELGLLLIISSLTAEKGYCYASNKYFADLFKTTEETISRKIRKLENNNYIKIEYEKRGCEIKSRKIRLTKISIDDYQKYQSTIDENVKDNNISNNINSSSYYELNNNIYNYNNYNNIYNYIESNYGRTISPLEIEKLNVWFEDFDEDIIKYAFEISILNNKRNFNYVFAILKNWKTQGYKKLQEIKDNETNKNNKKETKLTDEQLEILNYDWFESEEKE